MSITNTKEGSNSNVQIICLYLFIFDRCFENNVNLFNYNVLLQKIMFVLHILAKLLFLH